MKRDQRETKRENSRLGKHACAVLASLAVALFLTGCGSVIPIMNSAEEQAVSEYAALLLLKYDAHNRSRLVDLSLIKEESEKLPDETEEPDISGEEQGMGPVADTPVVELPGGDASTSTGTVRSMEEFFHLPEGMSFAFQGTQIGQSYLPEGEDNRYFTMDADTGKSMLILKYTLNNQSGADQTVDLFGPVIRVTVNGDYTEFVQMTMLTNDLSTYSGTIRSGESQELVLVVEIDQAVAENISTISLNLKKDENVYTTSLL